MEEGLDAPLVQKRERDPAWADDLWSGVFKIFDKMMHVSLWLWWPEIALAPFFFFFGYYGHTVRAYIILVACYLAVGGGKYINIQYLREVVHALNEFERNQPALLSIQVRSGWYIDKITFYYEQDVVSSHGSEGGGLKEPFVLNGEQIVKICGNGGLGGLDGVEFITNTGRKSPMYGITYKRRKGSHSFVLEASEGNQIYDIVRNDLYCGHIRNIIQIGRTSPKLAGIEDEYFLRNDRLLCGQIAVWWPKWVTVAISTTANYVEVLTSTLSAGASFKAWSPTAQARWAKSWSLLIGSSSSSSSSINKV
eukprot:TRINITY_DN77252_c0_g1_i1.p1 TRINITY_DN77252_c0_g1~~TRINITY_DN77252_c0_g1_i1.p1  ORF type:complete len:308 (+),score=33.12 TRINITY_DN77252_c0_g1_i1:55-978(+)